MRERKSEASAVAVLAGEEGRVGLQPLLETQNGLLVIGWMLTKPVVEEHHSRRVRP